MSSDDDYEGPSEEERALQREQVELLRLQKASNLESQRIQDLLTPFLLGSAGFDPEFNTRDPDTGNLRDPNLEEGAILSLGQAGGGENAQIKKDIESQLLQRYQSALSGDLPISPGIKRDLEEQEMALASRMEKQLGPGWETGSPGQKALSRFKEREALIKYGARTGDLTLADQLLHSGMAGTGQTMAQMMSIPQANLPFANALGQTASGFNAPIGTMGQNRAMRLQSDIARGNQMAALWGGGMGALGSLGGAALFAPSLGAKGAPTNVFGKLLTRQS